MTIPLSAVGKVGVCPGCSALLEIGPGNTRRLRPTENPALFHDGPSAPPQAASGQTAEPLAHAHTLVRMERHAEALAVFESLRSRIPHDPALEAARQQCLRALRRPRALPAGGADAGGLTPELVKQVILQKMHHGKTEAVQLRAAHLAARVLGMEARHGAAAPPARHAAAGPHAVPATTPEAAPVPHSVPDPGGHAEPPGRNGHVRHISGRRRADAAMGDEGDTDGASDGAEASEQLLFGVTLQTAAPPSQRD